ncbi:TetR family transcriptional regulator [Actinocorallia herbida]|uniref:TetR family transcriptional regulator n=1 Tax=Actinocorallia herbida TaxID=58109 RepID=A0A3N1CUK2_9ACTN|nr:TetR family transcriptional regulator [Actinocorallia herbida]ROO84983.1 TetR family transcriptional regulator [Actinocorallia herbida]
MSERRTSARGAETRERILDAAERLMAERGISGVSLNEINTAAGQRNTAALHYHFGGREELVRAILRRHGAWLRARHDELYAALDGREPSTRELVEVIVLPVAEYVAEGPSARAAIRIWVSAINRPELAVEEIQGLVDATLTRAARVLIERMPETMPRPLAVARLVTAAQAALHVLADRAVLEDAPEPRRGDLPLPLVAANLVDMTVAALTAPVSETTRAAAVGALDPASA